MPKLILSMDGLVLKEISLSKELTSIGRKPTNDIQIDNLAISGEHAVIRLILDDAFLEDRNSTNGTYVNGQSVKKHVLKNNDLIELGKYRLKYIADVVQAPGQLTMGSASADQASSSDITHIPTDLLFDDTAGSAGERAMQAPQGVIRLLSGANAGRELELIKSMTTLGKPGVQVAILTRRHQDYFLSHGEGDVHPTINGVFVEGGPVALKDHDMIEIAGIRMEFFLKGRN